MKEYALGEVCKHGQLARKCPICERDEEIKELRAKVEMLQKELEYVQDQLVFACDQASIRMGGNNRDLYHRLDDLFTRVSRVIDENVAMKS